MPETFCVRYGTRLAAVVRDDGVALAPRIAALERDHPIRRFVSMKCLLAHEMQAGPDAEPYDEAVAEFYVRYALMPEDEFADLEPTMSDAELAEHFNVPLEQVVERRFDLLFLSCARRARD